jgi:hypothetical protein
MRVHTLALLLAACAAHPPPAKLGPPRASDARSGVVDIDGHRVSWRVALNGRSWAGLRRRGDAIVGLRASGSLARIDPRTLLAVRENLAVEDIITLGDGPDGQLLGGNSQGNIVLIDPETLETRWIEGKGCAGGPATWVGGDSLGYEALCSAGMASQGGNAHGLLRDGAAGAFLDADHRVWLAGNLGEFGGWIGRFDRERGRYADVSSRQDSFLEMNGVNGFIQVGDQLLTFGGMCHFEARAFIARITNDEITVPIRMANLPPITTMLNTPAGLVYAAGSELWRINDTLDQPVKLATLTGAITGVVAMDDGGFVVASSSGLFAVHSDATVVHSRPDDEIKITDDMGAELSLRYISDVMWHRKLRHGVPQAVDGLGRTWTGDVLLDVQLGKDKSLMLRDVPGVGHRPVLALQPDPERPDGVIVTFAESVVRVAVAP